MTAMLTAPPDHDPFSSGYDEAFGSGGTPREHYAAVIEAIMAAGPGAVASAMTAAARTAGLSLGTGHEARLLPVDPVPRVFHSASGRSSKPG